MALKRRYKHEMDLIMAPVMPDDWDGHDRIEQFEQSEQSGFEWAN